MWPNPQFTADLVTFTEKVRNGKLYFLCTIIFFLMNMHDDFWPLPFFVSVSPPYSTPSRVPQSLNILRIIWQIFLRFVTLHEKWSFHWRIFLDLNLANVPIFIPLKTPTEKNVWPNISHASLTYFFLMLLNNSRWTIAGAVTQRPSIKKIIWKILWYFKSIFKTHSNI